MHVLHRSVEPAAVSRQFYEPPSGGFFVGFSQVVEMTANDPMLQPSADSTGYWLVWGLVLTGKWVKEARFLGWCAVIWGRFQRDRGEKRVKRCFNGSGCSGNGCLFFLYSAFVHLRVSEYTTDSSLPQSFLAYYYISLH